MITESVKDLTRQEYELFRKLVYAKSGINLGDQKMNLVRSRLGKLVRSGGFGSFRAYYQHVEADASGEQLCALLDAISTNTTHLFREIRHFGLLSELIGRWLHDAAWRRRHDVLRIWSAGCSSGEEPHSIVMVAHEALGRSPGVELKILATDISTRMLDRARRGEYALERVGTVPPELRGKCFRKIGRGPDARLQLAPELMRCIKFARFNLMTPTFPFRHGFDVIFCRNVMIYFDRPTQEALVSKFAAHLRPGGYLMIGHSESLNSVKHPLSYVEPTVYRKGAA